MSDYVEKITNWLLQTKLDRFNLSTVRKSVRAVGDLDHQELAGVMAFLVAEERIVPAGSRSWTVHPGLRAHYAKLYEDKMRKGRELLRLAEELRSPYKPGP